MRSCSRRWARPTCARSTALAALIRSRAKSRSSVLPAGPTQTWIIFSYRCRRRSQVDASQNCGNMLAGVGPFAIEHGLVPATPPRTSVRIHMVNTASIAVAHIQTPDGRVRYDGDARIDGVPGTAAPIDIDFLDIAGSAAAARCCRRAILRRHRGVRRNAHR